MSEPDISPVELYLPVQARVRRVYVGQGVAFVPHPHINGAWVRTHPCVVEAACPVCNVPAGSLCLGRQKGFSATHHYMRANAASAKKKDGAT